jgi:thiosulfate/3-mercaptopyruvate sulfurtransferase
MGWADAINYKGNQRLKPIEVLENIYHKKLNINKNDSIILYCYSGVRSTHTPFVLTQLLGYKNVKNYKGSWTEWSHYNNLPFKNDSVTQIK